jgi:hypothetical protein
MDEDFELPVFYKGKEEHFTARLVRRGYVYQIEVMVKEQVFAFERDEEGSWRVIMNSQHHDHKTVDVELIQSMVHSLEEISK